MSDIPATLTVFSREYCHLCADMIAGLEAIRHERPFSLQVIDVDEDPALELRYGDLVPVLVADGKEICRYHLDPAALDAYFDKIR